MVDYTPQTWVDGSGGGTPLSAARLAYIEAGVSLVAEATTDATTDLLYAEQVIRWNGSGWRWNGTTVTARPTAIPAWPDGHVMWDTSQDVTVVTPPSLAVNGDKWRPHGSAVVVLS